jgi:hypothetical protein
MIRIMTMIMIILMIILIRILDYTFHSDTLNTVRKINKNLMEISDDNMISCTMRKILEEVRFLIQLCL